MDVSHFFNRESQANAQIIVASGPLGCACGHGHCSECPCDDRGNNMADDPGSRSMFDPLGWLCGNSRFCPRCPPERDGDGDGEKRRAAAIRAATKKGHKCAVVHCCLSPHDCAVKHACCPEGAKTVAKAEEARKPHECKGLTHAESLKLAREVFLDKESPFRILLVTQNASNHDHSVHLGEEMAGDVIELGAHTGCLSAELNSHGARIIPLHAKGKGSRLRHYCPSVTVRGALVHGPSIDILNGVFRVNSGHSVSQHVPWVITKDFDGVDSVAKKAGYAVCERFKGWVELQQVLTLEDLLIGVDAKEEEHDHEEEEEEDHEPGRKGNQIDYILIRRWLKCGTVDPRRTQMLARVAHAWFAKHYHLATFAEKIRVQLEQRGHLDDAVKILLSKRNRAFFNENKEAVLSLWSLRDAGLERFIVRMLLLPQEDGLEYVLRALSLDWGEMSGPEGGKEEQELPEKLLPVLASVFGRKLAERSQRRIADSPVHVGKGRAQRFVDRLMKATKDADQERDDDLYQAHLQLRSVFFPAPQAPQAPQPQAPQSYAPVVPQSYAPVVPQSYAPVMPQPQAPLWPDQPEKDGSKEEGPKKKEPKGAGDYRR